MQNIIAITKKELRDYFYSPTAYVFITVFLMIVFWVFFSEFFVRAQANMRGFFNLVPFLFLVFLPAVTMGMWADEKKSGTLEILLTHPVRDWEVVLGKFLASLLFLKLTLFFTLPLVITVSVFGDLDLGPVIGGYVGLFLLGASMLAVGLYMSSLTTSAIVAFILSFLILFLFYIVGEPLVLNYLPPAMAGFFMSISLSDHYQSVARGVIDSRDIIFYASITGFFLYLNVLSLEKRKWE